MREKSDKRTVRPRPANGKKKRIRREKIDELDRLCHRVSAEARRRGLTEEILNEILCSR